MDDLLEKTVCLVQHVMEIPTNVPKDTLDVVCEGVCLCEHVHTVSQRLSKEPEIRKECVLIVYIESKV